MGWSPLGLPCVVRRVAWLSTWSTCSTYWSLPSRPTLQGRVGWRLWRGCWSTVGVAREWEERASPITEPSQRSRREIEGPSPHFWTSFKIIEEKQLIPNEMAMRMSGGASDHRNLRLRVCSFRAKGWKSSFGVNSRDFKDRSISDSHVEWASWDFNAPKNAGHWRAREWCRRKEWIQSELLSTS